MPESAMDQHRRSAAGTHQLRCLIIGAGRAGQRLARDLRRSPEMGLLPIGFLDDDAAKRHRRVARLRVLGTTDDLVQVARVGAAEVVIIAIPALPPAEIRRLAALAAAAGASVRYLPSFVAAIEREARVSDLRRMRISSLLGRREVHVVRSSSRSVVAGKRVLVTGAGGSIGSELCRQIWAFEPEALYLLDHDESNLHRLQLQLNGEALLDADELVMADVRDEDRIHQVFEELRPQVVFHAAAHKHLPLLERHPCEGVKSNVLGTLNLVDASVKCGTERFILISTDKAADPTSILGVTKRLAEMVITARVGLGTKVASVRFGNVLGSRGSFLSVLSEQIENGEPVTVTHPDVTRYFMTVEEAVGLVIEAAGMAENGEIFVLDMGEPVRIVDLVRNYATQLHWDPDTLPIRFTGLRPGEKLEESLVSDNESRIDTTHPRIFATVSQKPLADDFADQLRELFSAARVNNAARVRALLAQLVPEYVGPPNRAPVSLLAAGPYPDGF